LTFTRRFSKNSKTRANKHKEISPTSTIDRQIDMAAYQEISRRKLAALDAAIPSAWRLPADLIAASASDDVDVMDVPRSCGLLDRRQLEITENWDVEGLWREMVAGRLAAREVCEAFCKVSLLI
jgi:hypothetical protein